MLILANVSLGKTGSGLIFSTTSTSCHYSQWFGFKITWSLLVVNAAMPRINLRAQIFHKYHPHDDKRGMWQKRMSILLMSLIGHWKKCMCLLSHSSYHMMRPVVWSLGCSFKAFLWLLVMKFYSSDHGHLIRCWPSLTVFYRGMVVLSLLASKSVLRWKLSTAPELWFLHPTNQVLQREQTNDRV